MLTVALYVVFCVQNNYAECRMPNPLRCELGDQSNKLGTYDMNSGPMVATDVYLPLSGKQGGRIIQLDPPCFSVTHTHKHTHTHTNTHTH